MPRRLSESFIHRMAEAAFWESYVATCLSRMGFHVMHYPTDIREDGFQKAGMYDSADLAIVNLNGGADFDIEVKSWATGAPYADEFGHDRVLCSRSSWLKNGYSSHLHPIFVIVNKSTGEMLWLPGYAPTRLGLWSDPGRDYVEKVVAFRQEDLLPMQRLKEDCRGLIKKT